MTTPPNGSTLRHRTLGYTVTVSHREFGLFLTATNPPNTFRNWTVRHDEIDGLDWDWELITEASRP